MRGARAARGCRYAELAATAGITEGRAARRLIALLRARVSYLDFDLSTALLGYRAMANIWLTVSPSQLHAAGRSLAGFGEVAFAAAVSGPQNLTASVTCLDLDHLYRFATEKVGALPGVTTLEISPVLRHIKQAGAMLSGGRLLDAPAPPKAPRRRRRRAAGPPDGYSGSSSVPRGCS